MNLWQACVALVHAYRDGRLVLVQGATVAEHQRIDEAMQQLESYLQPRNDRK